MSITVEDEVWTMKDGTRIPIAQMSERHAKNCLRLLIRRRRERVVEGLDEALERELDGVMFQHYIDECGDR